MQNVTPSQLLVSIVDKLLTKSDKLSPASPDLSAACTCWKEAAELVTETKALQCSAKSSIATVSVLKDRCLSKFSDCKRAEDVSVGLIQVCNGRTTPSTASAPVQRAPAPAPALTVVSVPTPSSAVVPSAALATEKFRQTITFCPAEKASALKLLYNQVYNFKRQLKRAQSQVNTVKNKKGKKDSFRKDAAIVTDSVGGNLLEPTCAAEGR